jgi:hypothetical protein
MNDSLKKLQPLSISILVVAVLAWLAYFIAPAVKPVTESFLDTTPQAMGIRFLFLAIGGMIALLICYFTRDSELWDVTAQQVAFMGIGSLIYGVFAWLFNGATFAIPAVSQVSLRPAIIFPIFFGYIFGPVVGFTTGAAGNIIGDLFVGTVSPHWSLANGLIGLIAGAAKIFADRKQAVDVGTILTGAGGLIAVVFYLIYPTTMIALPPDYKAAPITWLMGYSVLIGCALTIAVRFILPNRQRWVAAVLWGSVGNIVGLSLASLADMWVNKYQLADAMVGEFIPAAGANIIAVAILIPLLLFVYETSQEQNEEGG